MESRRDDGCGAIVPPGLHAFLTFQGFRRSAPSPVATGNHRSAVKKIRSPSLTLPARSFHFFSSTVILNALLLTVTTPKPSLSVAPLGAGETPVFQVAVSSYSPGCVQ